MKPTLKILFTNILAFAALTLTSPTYAVPTLSFGVSDPSPTVGDAITVDLVVTDVTDLFAFNLDVGFAPAVLGVDSVVPGSLLTSGGLTLGDLGALGFDTTTSGQVQDINDSLLGPIPGVSGSGTLATINFDVLGAGTGGLAFLNVNALAGTEMVDSTGAPITITNTSPGSVTAADTVSIPEPPMLIILATGMGGLLVLGQWKRVPAG